MKLRILSIGRKDFTTDEGDKIEYYRYVAERLSDESVIKFGSKNGGHGVGSTVDLALEKSEGVFPDGKPFTNWKEISGF